VRRWRTLATFIASSAILKNTATTSFSAHLALLWSAASQQFGIALQSNPRQRGAMRDDDLPGRLGEMIRYGRVTAVDLAAARVMVELGDLSTTPIRWITPAAGDTRIWSPPTIGEQVIVMAPDGDIAGAIAVRGIFRASRQWPEGAHPVR
jgi:hypothetical protein